MSKPTICPECGRSLWPVGARSFGRGDWEAAFVCTSPYCRGWTVYDAEGRLQSSRTSSLDPGFRQIHTSIAKTLAAKTSRGVTFHRKLHKEHPNRYAKPSVCTGCGASLWVAGAHYFQKKKVWEVGMICPDPECPGWQVFSSDGLLSTHLSIRIGAAKRLGRTFHLVAQALATRHKKRKDIPQRDEGDLRQKTEELAESR